MEKLIESMKAQGKIFIIGECRGHRVETVKYVDKKSGQAAVFSLLVFLVERSGMMNSLLISQTLGSEEVDSSKVKVNVQKGKTYAFEISTLENGRGGLKAKMPSGIEPLPV